MLRLPFALITALLIATGIGAFSPSADTRLPFVLGGQATASTNTATSEVTGSPTATGTATTTGTPTNTSTVTPTPSTTATSTTTGTPTQTSTATATGTSTTTSTPTTTPTVIVIQPPIPSCTCDSDRLNCSDFDTQPQAQACMEICEGLGFGDINQLDGDDDDGVACESLPGGFRIVH